MFSILLIISATSFFLNDDTTFETRWTFPLLTTKLGLHGVLGWLTLIYGLQVFKEYRIKEYLTKSAFTRHSKVYILSLMFMISKSRGISLGNGLMLFNLLASFATTMIVNYVPRGAFLTT